MIFDLSETEEKIGYIFKDKMLLRQAFTHSSYVNEHEAQSNERLEFLGDSILGFVIACELFSENKDCNEGQLSEMRSQIVSAQPLFECIIKSGLNKKMLFSVGEQKNADNKNICADLFEAIVGAIFLDGGIEKAKNFILSSLRDIIKKTRQPEKTHFEEANFKGELCEYIQKHHVSATYTLIKESGEKHKPVFEVKCELSSGVSGKGSGSSKKAAEQNAAMAVLKKIDKNNKTADKSLAKTAKDNKKTEKKNIAKDGPKKETAARNKANSKIENKRAKKGNLGNSTNA